MPTEFGILLSETGPIRQGIDTPPPILLIRGLIIIYTLSFRHAVSRNPGIQPLLDAGSVIPDSIRDRHDGTISRRLISWTDVDPRKTTFPKQRYGFC